MSQSAAYTRMQMSKSIRLSDEAYNRLKAHKRDDETFTEVVLRLSGERSLLELAGIFDDEETAAIKKAIAERRDRRRRELEAVATEMQDS